VLCSAQAVTGDTDGTELSLLGEDNFEAWGLILGICTRSAAVVTRGRQSFQSYEYRGVCGQGEGSEADTDGRAPSALLIG